MKPLTFTAFVRKHSARLIDGALFAALLVGLLSDGHPAASTVAFVVLVLLALAVCVIAEPPRVQWPETREDYCDSDQHLADVEQHLPVVGHEQEQRV